MNEIRRNEETSQFAMLRLSILVAAGCAVLCCNGVRPETAVGPTIDASRNIRSVSFHEVARPDNPFPTESLVFVRHFLYVKQTSAWNILSSGSSGSETVFEDAGVYLLRLRPGDQPVRLLQVPGLGNGDRSSRRLRLAVAAPSVVLLDGALQIRNTSGKALVHPEDGPLYGGFSVDVPDSLEVADQAPTLVADTRVRVAALSFDGSTAGYVDDTGRLFTVPLRAGDPPRLLADLRSFFGPLDVKEMQWPIGTADYILLQIDRGTGPEAWSVDTVDGQIAPATTNPGLIREPGTDRLPAVDALTSAIPAGVWRVPAPSRFE